MTIAGSVFGLEGSDFGLEGKFGGATEQAASIWGAADVMWGPLGRQNPCRNTYITQHIAFLVSKLC